MFVVGFVGFKGSGKSTAARILQDKYGFSVRALAAPLKESCQIIFNLSEEQVLTPKGKEAVDPRWGMSPREMLQKFGTEVGRTFSEDVWIKSLQQFIDDRRWNRYTIDDVRFPNEADAIRKMGGIVVGVKRDEVTPQKSIGDRVPKLVAKLFGLKRIHDSERMMLGRWDDMVDITIDNNASLLDLEEKLKTLVDNYMIGG